MFKPSEWLLCSVCIERMKQSLSAIPVWCGKTSETSSPHSPYSLNSNGDGSNVFVLPGWWISTPFGRGWPAYFASMGFGSNKSIWPGPPFWSSWMTALARA